MKIIRGKPRVDAGDALIEEGGKALDRVKNHSEKAALLLKKANKARLKAGLINTKRGKFQE